MKDQDSLILSTIHSAKGKEWKSLFALNVVGGFFPSGLVCGTTEEEDRGSGWFAP